MDPRPHKVMLTLSASTLRRALTAAIAGSTAAAAATQAIAFASGRDFLFGLIPAFDPAGSRNLIVWLSSMLLGACAALSALVASLQATREAGGSRGWWTLAAVLGGYSIAWMTGLAGILLGAATPASAAQSVLVAAGAVLTVVMLFLTAAKRPAFPLGIWLALPLLVAARRVDESPSALAAASALASRLLEWLGMTCVLLAGTGVLASHTDGFSIGIDSASPRPFALRRAGGATVVVGTRALARWIVAAVVLLTAASLVSAWLVPSPYPQAESWYRFLFVDFEGNLPTWASAMLLMSCALVAALVAAAERIGGTGAWRYWAVIAAGFVALSADEAAALHELLVTPLRSLVGASPWLRYPLILPGSVAVLVTIAVFGRFVRGLPAPTRRGVVAGGGLFLFGALGLETAGGWFDPELHGANLPYVLLAAAEEACEMIGVAVVLLGLLGHIEHRIGTIHLHVRRDTLFSGHNRRRQRG